MKWKWVAIALLATGFLLWNPITRTAILWILPLGSGIDDLVMIAAFAIGVAVYCIGRARSSQRGPIEKQKVVFAAIIAASIVIVAVLGWMALS